MKTPTKGPREVPSSPDAAARAVAGNPDPRCPRCGFTMCELFDERTISAYATASTPNGRYQCYHCTPIAPSRENVNDRMQWSLDNIYTIAIREERYGGKHAKPWTHVRRLCERFGCAVRVVRPAGKDGEQKYGRAEDAKADAV
jgi:hypothetical protein